MGANRGNWGAARERSPSTALTGQALAPLEKTRGFGMTPFISVGCDARSQSARILSGPARVSPRFGTFETWL
jgi:hypothetical protein